MELIRAHDLWELHIRGARPRLSRLLEEQGSPRADSSQDNHQRGEERWSGKVHEPWIHERDEHESGLRRRTRIS